MKVTFPNVDQSGWLVLLMRAQAEGIDISEWLNAWVRKSTRQKDSVMPGVEKPQTKVVDIGGKR